MSLGIVGGRVLTGRVCQFRLYVGLLASLPEYRRVKHGGGATDAPIQQELSDDEELPKATQTRLSIVQDTLDQVPHPGKTLEPDVSDPQHRLLDDFTSNMEKSVKIFLSSHMRDADLIWFAGPHLLSERWPHFRAHTGRHPTYSSLPPFSTFSCVSCSGTGSFTIHPRTRMIS